MIPQRGPGQSLEAHQADVAFWLGTEVRTMNIEHDRLHASFCKWLGIASHALRDARGEALTAHERHLAMLEETAVLHTQRLMCAAKVGVPKCRG